MNDYTATVRSLTIGCGTDYDFAPQGFPAIWDTADIRATDVGRPRADGVVPGSDFMGGKDFSFVVRLVGSSAVIEQDITDLATAFAPENDTERLDIRYSGTPAEYAFFGRCRGIQVAWRTKALPTSVADVRCTFTATDPIRYGAEQTQEIGLAADTLPNDLPFILGVYDSEVCANSGGAAVDRWSVEMEAIGGDLVSPSISHTGTGEIIFHDLTVSSGDTLVVDGRSRRALLNGVTPVVPTIAQWFKLAPGNNTIQFAASPSSSMSSTATMTWRPGWA